jgi:magnesium chelatase family protein
MLVAASNPCPCGRGEADPGCTCSAAELRHHAYRLDRLAARFDIVCEVASPPLHELGGRRSEMSAEVAARVMVARAAQRRRLGAARTNGEMGPAEVRGCGLDEGVRKPPRSGSDRAAVIRVARTLADLRGADLVSAGDLDEARALHRSERI